MMKADQSKLNHVMERIKRDRKYYDALFNERATDNRLFQEINRKEIKP